jgi:hypothetical protein
VKFFMALAYNTYIFHFLYTILIMPKGAFSFKKPMLERKKEASCRKIYKHKSSELEI